MRGLEKTAPDGADIPTDGHGDSMADRASGADSVNILHTGNLFTFQKCADNNTDTNALYNCTQSLH